MTITAYEKRTKEEFRKELLDVLSKILGEMKKANAYRKDANFLKEKNNTQTSIIIETLFERLGIDNIDKDKKR